MPRSHWRPVKGRVIRNVDSTTIRQAAREQAACGALKTRLRQLHPGPAAGLWLIVLAMMLQVVPAAAHDASAYGGLFRSRSMGGAWLNADIGLFPSAALAVA